MGRAEDFIESAFSKEEREELLETNKYWNTSDNEFDPIDILIEGNYPQLKSQGDKFRCVMAVASFIKKRNSIDGIAEGFVNYMSTLTVELRVLCLNYQTTELLEELFKHPSCKRLKEDITGVAVP